MLMELRERARRALERGRQLWPAASHAEYRLALDAPAAYSAAVLVEGAGRFAIGPLPEVAASTHAWADLAPHVAPGPVAALAAHERVVRGERVDASTVVHAEVLAVPLAIEQWEGEYPVATYRSDRVDAPAPALPRGRPLASSSTGRRPIDDRPVDDRDADDAFRDVVRAWTAGSEGRARVVAVDGTAADAIEALGAREVRAAWLDPGEAVALLAWAGASGGRHGRRRGTAAGRDLAWAVLRALLGVDPDDPLDGDAVTGLRFLAWQTPEVRTGWILRLAVEDPDNAMAWAIDAVDPA
jgi:hypothetical protein